jgi:hypothetical protein
VRQKLGDAINWMTGDTGDERALRTPRLAMRARDNSLRSPSNCTGAIIPRSKIVRQVSGISLMDPERQGQIEQLYRAALEHPPEERGRFLAEACEGNSELRNQIEFLLAHARTTQTFLKKPAMESTAPAMVEDHAGQYGLEGEQSPTGFRSLGNEDAKSKPRPPWWMYLIAASFLAHVVFITGFWFFGPESMGIQVTATKTHLVVSKVIQSSPADRAGIRRGDISCGRTIG